MSHRFMITLTTAALLAGCGTLGQPNRATVAARATASASQVQNLSGSEVLARFEKLPSQGRVKTPAPLRTAIAVRGTGVVSDSIAKIQMMAFTALADAETKENWADRWAVTDAALAKIDMVKLDNGLSNLPAKVGFYAARGHGYMGPHPTEENRFRAQAVVLNFLRANNQEQTLAKGSSIFSMSADMLEACTGWDQGFRVGISILTVLKESYKDRDVTKSCQALLEKSCGAPTKEEAYSTMVVGLEALAKKLR